MREVVLWQTCVSPHMQALATSLAARGVALTYVAGRGVSADRQALGWHEAAMPGVRRVILDGRVDSLNALLSEFSSDAVHLVQGMRRNGYLKSVIRLLRARQARWGAIMETVRDYGLLGKLKRIDYRMSIGFRRGSPDFILAIGKDTPRWMAERGFPAEWIYPFTYFLPVSAPQKSESKYHGGASFNIGFVGAIDQRKRLDLLIEAIAMIEGAKVHLSVIGSGRLLASVKAQASRLLGACSATWYGVLPLHEVRRVMGEFDCLVLPSDHDGWGAVVTEALMAGVPAICSSACGAAEAVEASGVGAVFPRGDASALSRVLTDQIRNGPASTEKREEIARWALALGGEAGAGYLMEIIASRYGGEPAPLPPWRTRCVGSLSAQ